MIKDFSSCTSLASPLGVSVKLPMAKVVKKMIKRSREEDICYRGLSPVTADL